jgi:hypothetical protein
MTPPCRAWPPTPTTRRALFWLGTIVGETIGYALTAGFTVLVVIALTGTIAPKIVGYLGYLAAGLIATGVLIPLGPGVASLTNFAGYAAWCLWPIAMAVVLWRSRSTAPARSMRPAQLPAG